MSSQMSQAVVPRARRSGKAKRSRSAFEFKGRGKFARAVKKIVHEKILEKKFAYQVYNNQEMDYDGHRHYLSLVAAGTGENDRVGRHITPSYVSGKLAIYLSAASASTTRHTWSLLLVHDKQQVGDNWPSASDILTDIGTTVAPQGLMNAANRGRFKILRRWDGNLSLYNSIQELNIYHKLPGFVTKYNGSANTDIEGNGLLLLFVSSAAPADNMVYFSGHVRMWFTDA